MDIDKQLKHAKQLVNQILCSQKYYFSELKFTTLNEIPVVYIIANKTTDEVLYVGRTVNARRRLYTNHLHGKLNTARLKKYLINDTNLPDIHTADDAKKWIKENCYFQYLPIKNYKSRGYIEGLFGYLFEEKYIEQEH